MKEIIITYLLGYFIIFLLYGIYMGLGFKNVDSFLQGHLVLVIIIFYLLTSIYLYLKNRREESKIGKKEIFPCVYFGISFAVLFNMIIFYFFGESKGDNISFLLSFISSGIVGPIYEEILFRYLFYNRLKNRFSVKKSIFIGSIVFGIIHFHVIKSIYAFIFGIFLSFFYERKKNILVPIIIHVSANSIVLFLNGFCLPVFILSIVNFIISYYLILR